ncbi:MAG: winged helix-turn-helix transcriptional regulator [Acidobacteriota bacterium]|nr:winged helix-turn-helix transcriptional regulator [Acidobacteriota bacterium]
MQRTGSAKRQVSDLRKHVGFWMRFVSNHVSHAFARKLEQHRVTVAEWVVLREMYGGGRVAPSDVAARTGLTRGAISKLVDRLVEKKLVLREDRMDDRRYQDVALTAAGSKLVPVLAELADGNDEEFFQVLPAGERAALLETLKKLVEKNRLHTLPTN